MDLMKSKKRREKREREREKLVLEALLGWGIPTATLASEIQPTEKGRITSLSILSLIF